MNSNSIVLLNSLLERIEAQIKRLENSPNRVFELIEYDTLKYFHYFNLHFEKFWDEFDHNSASQLLQFETIVRTHSALTNRYVSLIREQLEYLEREIYFKAENEKNESLLNFQEDNGTDVIKYYQEYFKSVLAVKGRPLQKIFFDNETQSDFINVDNIPKDFHVFCSYQINDSHYKGLGEMFNSLTRLYSLFCIFSSYKDKLLSGYKPSQEEIIKTLEKESRQYAKEFGRNVEHDLKKLAQDLKTSRNTSLTPDIWGKVMKEEDILFDLAIHDRLDEKEEKRLEHISATKEKLINNYSLLDKIKSTCLDEELFDIKLSVETHHLLSSLDADNLELFYELILRRNIIQREMFPDKLRAKYEEWVNSHEEQLSDDCEEISEDIFMPQKLATEKAMKYWKRLQQIGFVDNHYMLLESTTRQQAAYIAELFAEKLGIRTKWKTFEDFWHIKNLAQEKNKRTELGKMPSRSKEIDEIFKD